MKRLALVLSAAACLLVAPATHGQLNSTAVAFTAVDGVSLSYYQLTITGVVRGDATASTRTFDMSFVSSTAGYDAAVVQTCARLATLALTKPGAYVLEVQTRTASHAPGCALSRATP